MHELSLLQQLESSFIPKMKRGQIFSVFPPGAAPKLRQKRRELQFALTLLLMKADPAVTPAMAVPGTCGRAAAAAGVRVKRKHLHMKAFLSLQTQPPASFSRASSHNIPTIPVQPSLACVALLLLTSISRQSLLLLLPTFLCSLPSSLQC